MRCGVLCLALITGWATVGKAVALPPLVFTYEHCIQVHEPDRRMGCFLEEINSFGEITVYAEEHMVQFLNAVHMLDQLDIENIFPVTTSEFQGRTLGVTGGYFYDFRDLEDPLSSDGFDMVAWGMPARDAAGRQTATNTFRMMTPTDPLASRCVVGVMGGALTGGLTFGFAAAQTGVPIVIAAAAAGGAAAGGMTAYATFCEDEKADDSSDSSKGDKGSANQGDSGGNDDADSGDSGNSGSSNGGSDDEEDSSSSSDSGSSGSTTTETPDEDPAPAPPPTTEVLTTGEEGGPYIPIDFGPYGPPLEGNGPPESLPIGTIMTPVSEGGCGLGGVSFYRFHTEPLVDKTRGQVLNELDPYIYPLEEYGVLTDAQIIEGGLEGPRFDPTEHGPIDPPREGGYP